MAQINADEKKAATVRPTVKLIRGDCLAVLKRLEAGSVDTVVTDPPYFLGFMNKGWDKTNPRALNCDGLPGSRDHGRKPGESSTIARKNVIASQKFHEAWVTAALRVLKPGGYMLAFGGTRTYHRMACAIEDGGFEIRDTLMWVYGQGFPKGRGCLKPAWEPITLARRPGPSVLPLPGLDGCRVEGPAWSRSTVTGQDFRGKTYDRGGPQEGMAAGRWPPNLLLSHSPGCVQVGVKRVKTSLNHHGPRPEMNCGRYNAAIGTIGGTVHDPDGHETVADWRCVEGCPVQLMGEQSGECYGGSHVRHANSRPASVAKGAERAHVTIGHADSGTAARFFPQFPPDPFLYAAKASRSERNRGCEGMEERAIDRYGECGQGALPQQTPRVTRSEGNHHPTVKPVALMRWLCRLITPAGGLVLDPFCGSGSTGAAAVQEGLRFTGIDESAPYLAIARRRIKAAQAQALESVP